MFGLGWSETVVLFVLGLIVIGPKQLPEVARNIGKMINELKRSANSLKGEFNSITSEDLFAERPKPYELAQQDQAHHGADTHGPDTHDQDPHTDQLTFDLTTEGPSSPPGTPDSVAQNGDNKKKTDG